MKAKTARMLLIVLALTGLSALLAIPARAKPAGPNTLLFVQNVGQFPPAVRYQVNSQLGTVWVTDDGIWITQLEPRQTPTEASPRQPGFDLRGLTLTAQNVKLTFPGGAVSPEIIPANRLGIVRTFVTPAGEFGAVPVYDGLRLRDAAPGMDLSLENADGRLVFRLIPTAPDARLVEAALLGAHGIAEHGGQAWLRTAFGETALPFIADRAGVQVAIEAGGRRVTVTAGGAPDAPTAPSAGSVVFGSYYGVSGFEEYATAVARTGSGDAVFAGTAPVPLFTAEAGVFVPQHQVSAFVVKISADGSAFKYIVTVSGSDPNGEEFINAMSLDIVGNAYVVGETSSFDFPTTPGAFDPTPNGGYDAFAVKVKPDGSGLYFSTVLGTAGDERGYGIAAHSDYSVFVTGATNASGFPITGGAYDPSFNGDFDAFVLKLNSTGSAMLAGTFLGGSGSEGGDPSGLDSGDLVLDAAGNAYVTGVTRSSNYPVTTGPYGATGCADIRLTKLNSTLSAAGFSTKMGGGAAGGCGTDGDDWGNQLFLDGSGNIYVTGFTSTENGGGFPTSPGAYQTGYGSLYDAFVLKLNPAASSLLYGTYLGGSSVEYGDGVAVDSAGKIYLAGYTYSGNYPVTGNAYDSTIGGVVDAFVAKINPAGSGAADLEYSTYLGGSGLDLAYDLSLHGQDILHLTGYTSSSESSFPVTGGAAQTIYSGNPDAFILLFHLASPATPPPPAPIWTPAPFNLNLPVTINE
jgi:hypothetical protein